MQAHSPVREAELGGWRYLDYYGMSEGASSYDGTHYSLQVRYASPLPPLVLLARAKLVG